MDDDGDMDLLVGDADGYVTYYSRNEDGTLTNRGYITVSDEEIMVWRAAPHIVDWDLDGDYDLLLGMFHGNVALYENTGTAEEFEFTDRGYIQADGRDVNLVGDSSPALADLDRDGKRDLIVGCTYGIICFYPNIGEDDDPEFGQEVELRDEDGSIALTGYSRIEVVDWDNDGDLDIITGMYEPQLYFFENPTIDAVKPAFEIKPSGFNFISTYPEPFNGSVVVQFAIPYAQPVQLTLYSISGKRLLSRNIDSNTSGLNQINYDFSDLPSSKYFVQVSGRNFNQIAPVTLIK